MNEELKPEMTLPTHICSVCETRIDMDEAAMAESVTLPNILDDEIFHRRHLTLDNPILFNEYKSSQKKAFDLPSILPLILTLYAGISTRSNFDNGWRIGSPAEKFFTAGLVTLMLGTIIFLSYVASHVISRCFPEDSRSKNGRWSSFCDLCEIFLRDSFYGRVEDVIAWFGITLISLYLIARVVAGQCESTTNIWASQKCNPVAFAHSLPHDHVILLYSTPLVAQIVLKNVSVQCLALLWSIISASVLYCIIALEAWLQMYSLLYVIVFVNISYEVERLTRVAFLHNKEMLTVEREKMQSLKLQQENDTALMTLHSLHQTEIFEMTSENERKLR